MIKKHNTDSQVGWVAWGSLVICMAALFVILRCTLDEAFAREAGVILVAAAATAGFISAASCRRFGLLTGLTLPTVFGLAWALELVSSEFYYWRMTGLAVGIYLALVGGRVAMHMIYVDQRSRERNRWLFSCVVLLAAALIAGFRFYWSHISNVPHGLEVWSQRVVIVWGLLILIWRPELLLRLFAFILGNTFYRVRLENAELIPDHGPVVIVSNHVSFLDALFIMALKERKVTILIHRSFYLMVGFRLFFRWIGALEVPDANQPKQMRKFFRKVHKVLLQGGMLCIFPEGSISSTGVMQEFKTGVASLLPHKNIPVIPIHMSMLWGSLFRIHQGHLRFIKPHKLPIPATVYVGKPIPGNWSGFQIWQRIGELGAEAEMPPIPGEKPIHHRFLKRAKQRPLHVTFQDCDEKKPLNDLQFLARSILISKKLRKIIADRADDSENMGIMLSNGTLTAAALLAVWFADRRGAMIN